MKQSKESKEIGFIRARALDDLANTSDEEIRNEYREAGQDMAAIAKQTLDTLRDVVAVGMRAKLASAKAATTNPKSPWRFGTARNRPTKT
jgi:uncharacterized membrane protein YukC